MSQNKIVLPQFDFYKENGIAIEPINYFKEKVLMDPWIYVYDKNYKQI